MIITCAKSKEKTFSISRKKLIDSAGIQIYTGEEHRKSFI